MSTTDENYMAEALAEARKAEAICEVPIGCVIVKEDQIIARAYNRRNRDHSTLAHAEILAIGQACDRLQDWRLEGCTMYVTLEPCSMCAGALIQSRIDRVVIGAMNAKAGCAGSVLNLLEADGFNHRICATKGVLEGECSSLLQDFFQSLRKEQQTVRKEETDKPTLLALLKAAVQYVGKDASSFTKDYLKICLPKEKGTNQQYQTGEILFAADGVLMVLGICEDQSILLADFQSAGMKICGMETQKRTAKKPGQAIRLARRIMKNNWPECYEKDRECCRQTQVFEKTFQWNFEKNGEIRDPEGLRFAKIEKLMKKIGCST